MLDYIRNMPDLSMVLTIIAIGMLSWSLFVAIIIGINALKQSTICQYAKLKRENARLRKYISELRKECLCGKSR